MSNAKQPEPLPQAEPVKQQQAKPVDELGSLIRWHRGKVLLVAADRSVRSVLRRVNEAAAMMDWVVVVRSCDGSLYYYAYRPSELAERAVNLQSWLDAPLQDALNLHEWASSARTRGGRPLGLPSAGHGNPARGRFVDFDAAGRVVGIGELLYEFEAVQHIDLGPMRGGPTEKRLPSEQTTLPEGPADTSPGKLAGIEVTISAEAKSEINIGAKQRVDFRIELSSEAVPLGSSSQAAAQPNLPIVVLLSVESDVLEIVGRHAITLQPPAPGQPRSGNFVVEGVKTGVSRLAVTFHQGGSELGLIDLAIEVVAGGANAAFTQGSTTVAPADPADDDKLAVIIEQRVKNEEVFYHYILHSEALNLQYEAFDSKPLLDSGTGPAATALAFIERIYARVTKELKSFEDLKQLQREARALGAGLSRELFDPDVARRLWPLRDRIKLIQIRSWEPYVPWELVRLHDPDTQDTDDRFLAEYNLVRTLTDRAPVQRLPMEKWRYLAATFPLGSLPAVGAELDYFTREAAPSLLARGTQAHQITATRDAFYDALADGEFDVLHISCHAESPHQSIEDSNLIISDAAVPGSSKPTLIQINTNTVADEAKLMRRRPLVFLNACETGRVGAVLTAWGGWPNVFVRSGAGAFVGAAWAVRDKPAAAFSTAFYEALWNDKTLAEAAGEAREAAKKFGDASWLAFKVYGHPRARRGNP